MFGRMWRVIKGWLLIGVEKAEDPEVILAEAQDSMRRELEKARESAIQAVAARNQLRTMLQDQQNRSATLEAKARAALKANDEELARHILVEKSSNDSAIEALKAQLAQAEQAAENVKSSIKQMEVHVKQRAAEQLALKTSWRQAKIQEQINKALSGISLEGQDQAFNRAKDKITELQSRADARTELAGENLNSRMTKLDNIVVNEKADAELEALKAQMGMTSTITAEDDTLARLKAEINQAPPQQQVNSGGNGQGRSLEL